MVRIAKYEVFENAATLNGSKEFNLSFTGKELDIDTGLYYYNARWYDPTLGRFLTEDPARSGINWLEYALNNPLKYTDPTGLMTGTSGDDVAPLKNGKLIERNVPPPTLKNTDDSVKTAVHTANGLLGSPAVAAPVGIGLGVAQEKFDEVAKADEKLSGKINKIVSDITSKTGSPKVASSIAKEASKLSGSADVAKGASRGMVGVGVALSALDVADAYNEGGINEAGKVAFRNAVSTVVGMVAGWGASVGVDVLTDGAGIPATPLIVGTVGGGATYGTYKLMEGLGL